ncbi:MAG: hypothetical protein ACRDE6_03525 [Candidatus Limnocylindria bacterium]
MEHSDPLPDRRFSWVSRADGTIVIRYGQAPVTLLRGRTAERFAARMANADGVVAQRVMARATGTVERDGRPHAG